MGQSVYKITTDQGEYNVTVDDGAAPEQPNQSSVGGLVMKGAGMALPAAQAGAEALAESPTFAANLGKVARWGTTLASPVVGAVTGGAPGALAGVAAAPKAGWAAGKTGYFGGKLIQDLSGAASNALETAEPYAKGALNTLAGAQGVLDLAQMADPKRTDIGVLGMGGKRPETVNTVQIKGPNGQIAKMSANATPPKGWTIVPGSQQAERNTHPALINAMADAFMRSISKAPDVWSDVIDAIKTRVQ